MILTQTVDSPVVNLKGSFPVSLKQSEIRRQGSWRLSARLRRRAGQAAKDQCEQYSILSDTADTKMIKCLLSTVNEWEFNIFTLDKLTNGRALFHTSLHLFQDYNFIETFDLDFVKLMRCITLIEEGYHGTNPYHNAVHAADVAQAMHCYLQEEKLARNLSPLEKMMALLSAITHDLDHPGVNQSFLIATSNPLATLYQNASVLESHHWRSAMGTFHESGLFDHFTPAMWAKIGWQLKSLILATDITRQQEFLQRFKVHLDKDDLDLSTNEEHRNFLLQIGLKCADICNPCRPWEVSKRWSEAVCDEFFKQGDYERKLQLPVTPFCDRYNTTVAKIQSGFMQFVVMPLFSEWKRFNRTLLSRKMFENIHSNKASWDTIQRTYEAQKAKEAAAAKGAPETVPEESEEEDLTSEEEQQLIAQAQRSRVCAEVEVTVEDVESLGDGEELSQEEEGLIPAKPPAQRSVSVSAVLHPDHHGAGASEHVDLHNITRRHSLPPPMFYKDSLLLQLTRRDSSQRSQLLQPQSCARRHSLPTASNLYASSFDRLVDKLSTLTECSPSDSNGNGSHFDFGERPMGMNVMSVSLDTNTLSSTRWDADKQTSAHGLDPSLFAQRPYTSEPQIPPSAAGPGLTLTSVPTGPHSNGLHPPNSQVTVHACQSGSTSTPNPSPASSSSPSSCSPTNNSNRGNNNNNPAGHYDTPPLLTVTMSNHHSEADQAAAGDMDTQPLLLHCADIPVICSGEDDVSDVSHTDTLSQDGSGADGASLLVNHYTAQGRHHSVPLLSFTALPCHPTHHRHSIATPTLPVTPHSSNTSGPTAGAAMDEQTPLLHDLIRLSQDDNRIPTAAAETAAPASGNVTTMC